MLPALLMNDFGLVGAEDDLATTVANFADAPQGSVCLADLEG